MNSNIDPRTGVLKYDATGKNRFDMENLLTRSLYRVMNNTSRVPAHVATSNGHNVDKLGHSSINPAMNVAIARPNNHKIGSMPSTDMELQMKLLAQEICSRVERKYERKLEAARDQDRRDTERRLNSIRGEYEAKYHLQLEKLEKEKILMLEVNEERKRSIEQRLDLRFAEKEANLDKKSRMLDNRMEELMMNRDYFEKVKEEFNKRMENELEDIRIEREKLLVNTVQVNSREKSKLSSEHDLQLWKKRAHDLENDADESRKKIAELMSENFRLTDEVGSLNHLEKEYELIGKLLIETKQKLIESKLENHRTCDFDKIKHDNDQFRAEIDYIKLQNQQRIQKAVADTVAEYEAKKDRMKRIMASATSRNTFLTEKCREFETERDILKQELKAMQKMVGRGTFPTKKEKNKRLHRPRSSTESSSSLSDGELDILNIKSRLQSLDQQAKEIDASVQHFSFVNADSHSRDRSMFENEVEFYDDFCRDLHRKSIDGSQKTSSPQKPIGTRAEDTRFYENDFEVEINNDENENHDWVRKSHRVVSPPLANSSKLERHESHTSPRNSVQKRLSNQNVLPTEMSPRRFTSFDIPSTSNRNSPRNDEAQRLGQPVYEKKQESPRISPVRELSVFQQKMLIRGSSANDQQERRNRMLKMAEEEEEKSRNEDSQPPNNPNEFTDNSTKPTSVDNPMFTGVDPVMAEYMKKIMSTKKQENTSVNSTTQSAPLGRPKEVEVMMSEELKLDSEVQIETPKLSNSKNDDEWW